LPIITEIQDRLDLAFPRSSDVKLFRAVQEGSYLADHLFSGETFLNNEVGRDLRGHIRRIGIAYQIKRYCEQGELPFLATMKLMPKGRWHWLEITSTGAVAHVCRTDDVMAFPDEAESRQDIRLTLQPTLFSWLNERKPMTKIIEEIPRLYAWLTFRVAQDGRLSHLCWASPDPECDSYIGHINILERIATVGGESQPVSEVPDPKDMLYFKDHVARALDQGDEKKQGK